MEHEWIGSARKTVAGAFIRNHLTSVLIALAILLSLKTFMTWFRKYLILRKVPGPSDAIPPSFLLLNYGAKVFTTKASDMTYEFANFFCNTIERFTPSNEGIMKAYLGFEPMVLLSRAETAEVILTDNVNLTKTMTYHFMDKWMGGSLLTSDGDLWRFQRKLLTPAFHFKILDNFMTVFNDQAANYVKYLKNVSNKEDMRLFQETCKCTLNIIGETTLGYNLDAMSGPNTYGLSLSRLQFLLLARTVRPWMWLDFIYYRLTYEGSLANRCIKTMHELSTRILAQKKQQALEERNFKGKEISEAPKSKKLKSFMELLLDYHFQDPNVVPEKLVRTEVDTMLFAGQDTTATSTAWTMFLLGHHPHIQEKCRQEMFAILGPNPLATVDSEHLKLMKYTEACFKEAMRIYPPIPIIGRKIDTDIRIKGAGKNVYTIPAGVQVMTSLFHLHRDPKYFPEPEKFIPERFLDENAPHKSHPFAYIPFSGGPRNCIGQKFASMEVKVILAFVLRNFSWTSNRSRDDIKVCFEIVTRAKGDLRITLTPLEQPEQEY